MLPFVPVVADSLLICLLFWQLPYVGLRFWDSSGTQAAVLTAVFVIMCAGVILVRKLEARENGSNLTIPALLLDGRLHLISAIAFALLFVTLLAWQFGYFDAIFEANTLTLGEGEASALFVFAPGAWLAMAFLYVIFLVLKVTPTISMENGRYFWLASFALLAINLMQFTMTAQLMAWVQGQSLSGAWLWGLMFAGFALLFGPPRWIYLSKQPDWGGGLTSLVVWMLSAWLIIR
ncbi:MAG: hypothetical protein CSB13_03935 [Chloroflexi bacterium]|nr:MAG: hypothetical protein CSB13_03935 [Chloroflexota bacterium]